MRREPTFDHPSFRSWCPDHGYFWSSCPGCVWRDHGDKFGMTIVAVKTQEIAKALEDQRDRYKTALELLAEDDDPAAVIAQEALRKAAASVRTAHETAHGGPDAQ